MNEVSREPIYITTLDLGTVHCSRHVTIDLQCLGMYRGRPQPPPTDLW
jgi:hypothetical protein